MIKSFSDKRTVALFQGKAIKGMPGDVVKRANAKLLILNAAVTVEDLRVPPGNRLELLRGDREGQYSIRINKQWRICFHWNDGNVWDAEFCDYH